jgi:hypothetical protein
MSHQYLRRVMNDQIGSASHVYFCQYVWEQLITEAEAEPCSSASIMTVSLP